tara:strand:- start:880 stop:1623 length:744 start_codon:yes stop_codon:yes gene_type:complete
MMKWFSGFFLALTLTVSSAQDPSKLSPDAHEAYDALRSFAGASTWKEAAKYVLDPDPLRKQMEEHYSKFDWEPLAIRRWQYRGVIAIDGPVRYNTHNFEVFVETGPGALSMSVIQDGDAYKIDWELFAQFYDRSFEEFLKGPPSKPQTFRLNLVKGVSLDNDKGLPLLGEPIRLRAAWYPSMGYPGNIYAGTESDVGKKAKELVGWSDGRPFRATVQLSKSGKSTFVELTQLQEIDLSTPSVFPDSK